METEEVKTDERETRINELDELITKHNSEAAEFEKQLEELKVSLSQEEKILAESVERVLNAVPDKSPKHLVEDVLKMPVGKTEQLQNNIKKLQIAAANSRRKANLFGAAKQKILQEIREDELNNRTCNLYQHFEKWAELYNECEDYYYKLSESVRLAHLDSPGWHLRGQHLGLNPIILTCFDSYMKPGADISMNEVVIRCSDFSTAEGKPLFKKLAARMQDVPMEREYF